jgi:DNA-directed RNA polymerase subunit RPC12/RpoP
MPIVILRLPHHSDQKTERPRACPYCGSPIIQSWGLVDRNVQDAEAQLAGVHRYRCATCARTFRHYPPGIDRSSFSKRIRHIAALACALGMSCREVVEVFGQLDIPLSRMTVWRDAQELLASNNNPNNHGKFPRFYIDREYLYPFSHRLGVVVGLELGPDKFSVLGTLNETNSRLVKSWLQEQVLSQGIEVIELGTEALRPIFLEASPVASTDLQ